MERSQSQPCGAREPISRAAPEAAPSAVGSRLYTTYVVPDESHDGIMRQVWSDTPWIVDAFVGQHSDEEGRRRQMWEWCREHLGAESWPFSDNPRPGRWHSGGATVSGWQWWGFDTEATMLEFAEAFPSPLQTAPTERVASEVCADGQTPGGHNPPPSEPKRGRAQTHTEGTDHAS